MAACSPFERQHAVMITDVPEMAFCVDLFNASQDRYKIEVDYRKDLASAMAEPGGTAALAIGRYLKSSGTRTAFQSLDYLFSELLINQSAFYPGLLELGNSEGRQILLPVSFNLPLVLFEKNREAGLAGNFLIGMEELESGGTEFNGRTGASTARMGFGPRWFPDFLYQAVRLSGAGFREGDPLAWDRSGLAAGITRLRDWTTTANGSASKEDEFQFKYLYLPSYRSVQEGRIGYAEMGSAEFFVIPEERRSTLAFRWLSAGGVLPVYEDAAYAGLLRKGEGKPAAESFLKWFYSEDTQRLLLEDARKHRAMESSFGVAGGFSAIKSVNERLMPLFYPSLLGRLPPDQSLKPSAIMPSAWPRIKAEVILPFLLEATAEGFEGDVNEVLDRRLEAWLKRESNQ